jgi:hypothetical protein
MPLCPDVALEFQCRADDSYRNLSDMHDDLLQWKQELPGFPHKLVNDRGNEEP